MTKKIWMGTPPKKCQLCGEPITDTFIDGRVVRKGATWAIMCSTCHLNEGVGLGLGFGQKYQLDSINDEWIKIEG